MGESGGNSRGGRSPSRWARRKPTFYRQGRQLSCLMSAPRPFDAAGDGGAPPEWCYPCRFWEATKRRRRRKPSDNGPAVLPSGKPEEEEEEEGPCRPAARAPAHSEERLSSPTSAGNELFLRMLPAARFCAEAGVSLRGIFP